MTNVSFTGQVRRGLGWSAVNTLSLRVGNVVVMSVVARLLTPDEFGTFAAAMTVQLVLGTLAEFGLGADLVRAKDFERRAPTVATMALVVGVVLAGTMAVAAGPIASAFSSPGATPAVQLMAVSIVFSGLSVIPAALLQRNFQQSKLFAADATSLVVSTTVTVVLALLGFGAMALAWSRVVGQMTTTVLQFVMARRRPHFGLDRRVLRSVLAFGGPLAAANLLSWVLISIDNLLVARISGVVALGFYVLAFNVSSWPMSVIGHTVRVVSLPAFARTRESSHARAGLIPVTALTWSAGVGIGCLTAILASPLIHLLFGDAWLSAAPVLAALGLFGSLRVLFDLMATYLIAQGATRSVLVVQVIWLVVLGPSMVLGLHMGGLSGAGWTHVVVAGALVLPCYLVALSRAGVRVRSVLGVMAPPLLAALPAGAAAHIVAVAYDSAFAALLAGGLTGTALYVLLITRFTRRQVAHLSTLSDEHEGRRTRPAEDGRAGQRPDEDRGLPNLAPASEGVANMADRELTRRAL